MQSLTPTHTDLGVYITWTRFLIWSYNLKTSFPSIPLIRTKRQPSQAQNDTLDFFFSLMIDSKQKKSKLSSILAASPITTLQISPGCIVPLLLIKPTLSSVIRFHGGWICSEEPRRWPLQWKNHSLRCHLLHDGRHGRCHLRLWHWHLRYVTNQNWFFMRFGIITRSISLDLIFFKTILTMYTHQIATPPNWLNHAQLTCLRFFDEQSREGGVTSMEPFLRKFFPEVYRKMKQESEISNYCKFNSHLLTSFTSSLYIAGLIASFFASPVTRTFGRRASILAGGAAFLAGSALGGAALNIYMLILGRILLGVGVGFANQVNFFITWGLIFFQSGPQNPSICTMIQQVGR